MRYLFLSLLAATSAFANPFHMGASWEWRWTVFRGSGWLETSPVLAQVIDSSLVPESSGVVWSLRFARVFTSDSTVDTARLMTDFDGRNGRWLKQSSMFPFELRDIGDPCFSTCATPHVSTNSTYDSPFDLLHQLWNDSLGLLSGTVGYWRFDLIAKDGRTMPEWGVDFGRRMLLPKVGDVFVWEEKIETETWSLMMIDGVSHGTDSTVVSPLEENRWRFLARESDSSGWIRARVEQTRRTPTELDVKTKVLDIRWQILIGNLVVIGDSLAGDYAAGFYKDWLDSDTSSTWNRISSYDGGGPLWYHSRHDSLRIRSSGGLDFAKIYRAEYWAHDITSSGWSTSRTIRLLQVNDSVIRQPSPTGVRTKHQTEIDGGDLRALVQRYPSAMVTVRDVRGQCRTIRLDQLQSARRAGSLGVGWYELRLPDGSRRRGSFVN